MNVKHYFKRMPATIRPSRLRRKRVVVVGQGSGGSRVTLEMAMLGIQQSVVDRPGEILEEHNLLRHVLGADSLGQTKVSAMVREIQRRVPLARVHGFELDVVSDQGALRDLIRRFRPHLALACTDNEQSKHALDQVARAEGVPVIGAGVYDGGIGGEVYISRPGGTCYGCIAQHLQLAAHTPELGPNVDYNSLDPDEVRSTAALNLDIGQIVLVQLRAVLNELLNREPDLIGVPPKVNLFIFANRVFPNAFTRPLHCEFHVIEKRPDCLVCGTRSTDTDEDYRRVLEELESPHRPGSADNQSKPIVPTA